MPPLASPALAPIEPSPLPVAVADGEAIRAVVAGNREMFEVIVRRYNPQLYRVGMAYLRDHARTEDAMQTAYLKAFLNLRRFQGNAAFSTWLTRIMINECLMILRREKRLKLETLDDATARSDESLLAAPTTDGLALQEIKALLEQALQALPRTQRAVYLLREGQQLSTVETARCLGLSSANVKVALHRAREGIKAQLLKSAAGVELFAYPAAHCDPMTRRVMAAVRTADHP